MKDEHLIRYVFEDNDGLVFMQEHSMVEIEGTPDGFIQHYRKHLDSGFQLKARNISTCVTDLSDAMIFEGDVFVFKGNEQLVHFADGEFHLGFYPITYARHGYRKGNIYENPELKDAVHQDHLKDGGLL